MHKKSDAEINQHRFEMVRVKGVEPPRQRHWNLNPARLPIPPHPHHWIDVTLWIFSIMSRIHFIFFQFHLQSFKLCFKNKDE